MSFKSEETRGIAAVMILEAIGKPPEHLTEALENLIKEIEKEKGVTVLNKKINEPILMKDRKDFYTSFAEVEVEVEEVLHIAILMFKYMPAHIEIISPELIVLTNNGWNDLFNELTRRLHGYDEVARVIQIEKSILEKKLRELLKEKEGKK
ncbi:MAG: hypothetical protein AABX93_01375 [Nanoarchaeota archaeon]